jgi:hypothetical protein
MKQIIATNPAHNQIEAEIKNTFEKAKEVLKEFSIMEMPFKIKTQADFTALCSNPETFIKVRLTESMEAPQPIWGFKINKAKAVELLLELPNVERLTELCSGINSNLTKYLTFGANSVKLLTETLEKVKEDHSVIITNAAQAKVYEDHKILCEALNTWNEDVKKLKGHGIVSETLKDALRPYFIVREEGIKIQERMYLDNRGAFKQLAE